MISGTIILYDRSGQPVDSQLYQDRYTRGLIIDKWKGLYGKGYEKCEIGIEPDIYESIKTPPLKTNKGIEEKYVKGMGRVHTMNKQNRIKKAIIHQTYSRK